MRKTFFGRVSNIAIAFVLMAFMATSCTNKAKEDAKAGDEKTEEASQQSVEDIVKANLENLLYDIGQQKSERFHWLTKEDVLELFGDKAEIHEDGSILKLIVESPAEWEQETKRALEKFKEEGDNCGFDFNNYSFESLEIQTKVDDETKQNICRGTAVLKNGDKLFDLEFKNLMLMGNDAKFVDGFGIMPHGENEVD